MKQNQFIKTVIITTLLFVSACSPKVENRGYVNQISWKEFIKVGQTSKQEILDNFGSPSAQSSFGDEKWYYVSARKESIGFMKAEVVEQEVADITFDSTGVVSAFNIHNKDDAKDFALIKRTTPTEGHSLSFIDQTLGNLGRFNKPGGTGRTGRSTAGRGPF